MIFKNVDGRRRTDNWCFVVVDGVVVGGDIDGVVVVCGVIVFGRQHVGIDGF